MSREHFDPDQRKALDRELSEYVAAMTASLDFPSSGMNLGNLFAAQGDLDGAEAYYRTALEVDDQFFPAKMNLAVLLSQQGRMGEAEQLLREVLATYPDRHDASYSLALLLVGTGRSGEALEYLARASAGMPRRSRVHYNYGLLLAQIGEDGPAEAAFTKALDLEPDSMDYLFALIDFYYRRGRLEAALQLAERMIAAHPEIPLGHDLKVRIEARL